MLAFRLVYFCVSLEHIHPSQQCLGSELWWAGVLVDRILPKGTSHITQTDDDNDDVDVVDDDNDDDDVDDQVQ